MDTDIQLIKIKISMYKNVNFLIRLIQLFDSLITIRPLYSNIILITIK